MNEFVEQFLIEARELAQQATDDLLALENRPGDRERLDSAFRAFHTLKGGAGIVDFDAMSSVMHVAEDMLAAVRNGEAAVTPSLISDCLSCVDQAVAWLDAMQADGEAPAGASAAAETLVARFAKPSAPASPAQRTSDTWSDALLARHPEQAEHARSVIRFAPDPDTFYRGKDPLAAAAGIPGLLALELTPSVPWPKLAALDPFECRLVLTALSAMPLKAIAETLADVGGRVELAPVVPPAASGLSGIARQLFEAQLELAGESAADGLAARLGSVARSAANILRACGMGADAEAVERVATNHRADETAGPLRAMLRRLLDGEPLTASEPRPTDEAPAEADIGPVAAPGESQSRTLRVDVARVDALVKLAGELTVAKNALAHAAQVAGDNADPAALAASLKNQHAVLERLVGELQQAVLGLRVLPLRQAFERFPRLVREMAVRLGRPVSLVMEGEATEADKVIVEALPEPLLHVLRNAIDHGVESTDERAAAGKPATATVRLSAARRSEHLIVEVEDDGRGVDTDRVGQLAVERGIVSRDALTALTEPEVIELIFAPGFSTASGVSDLSGRGVGMDAVRTAVRRLGGRVQVESRRGQGSTVRFILPFTLMITRVVTVEAGGQMFGIPMESLVETVRVARDHIVPLGASHAFTLRERTVPVIDLAETLGFGPAEKGASAASGPTATVAVAAVSGGWAGLAVDRIGERMDVMLKPVDGLLAGAPGIAGATLLGDGRVLIVLDVEELVQ